VKNKLNNLKGGMYWVNWSNYIFISLISPSLILKIMFYPYSYRSYKVSNNCSVHSKWKRIFFWRRKLSLYLMIISSSFFHLMFKVAKIWYWNKLKQSWFKSDVNSYKYQVFYQINSNWIKCLFNCHSSRSTNTDIHDEIIAFISINDTRINLKRMSITSRVEYSRICTSLFFFLPVICCYWDVWLISKLFKYLVWGTINNINHHCF
jgi:hypothetical protein